MERNIMSHKVLIISPSGAYFNRMDMNHYDIMNIVRQTSNIDVIDEFDASIIDKYDIIISDSWPNIDKKIVNNPRIRVGKFFQDYYQMEGKEYYSHEMYDFAILRYKTPVTVSNKIFDIPYKFYISHHFDLNKYKNHGCEKIYDIILYGRRHAPLYPFRERMMELLLQNQHKYKIKYIPFCGYQNKPNIIRMEELSKLINQSWLTLSVPMNEDRDWDDFLQKFGEGSLSYALILGNIPKEAEVYYGDDYCRVTPNMTDTEILNVIDNELANKVRITEKTDRVYKTLQLALNVEDYGRKLYAVCEEILKSTANVNV